MEADRKMNLLPYAGFSLSSLLVFYMAIIITEDLFTSSLLALFIGFAISIMLTYIDYKIEGGDLFSNIVDSLPTFVLIIALLILGTITALNFYFKLIKVSSVIGYNLEPLNRFSYFLASIFIFSSQVLAVFVYTIAEWSMAIFLDIDIAPQKLLKANILCYLLYLIPVFVDYFFVSTLSDIRMIIQASFNVAIITKTVEIVVIFLYSIALKNLSNAEDKRVLFAAVVPSIVIGTVVMYILPNI